MHAGFENSYLGFKYIISSYCPFHHFRGLFHEISPHVLIDGKKKLGYP